MIVLTCSAGVEGCARADEARRAHGAAEPRVHAELHLRQPEAQLAVVRADAIPASERKLEAAAEGEAVDGRDRRHGQARESVEHFLAGAREAIGLLDVRQFPEFRDVGAGDESIVLGRAEDDRAGSGRLDLDKVRELVFVIDQGADKPGTQGTIWIDELGVY